jgi:hypothetical protein
MNHYTPRQRAIQRWGALKLERSSWERRWMDIRDYVLPFSGRYSTTDRNRGDKTFNKIIDSSAGGALDILSAGMMAGMTSPARPWFRLATPDQRLMEVDSVKKWLNDVAELMREVFARSNTYRALHVMYEELGAFCTAVNIVDDNYDSVIWNTPLTNGEFGIATDHLGRVNTLGREFEYTVAQVVEEFVYGGDWQAKPDWSRVSSTVKNLWDTHKAYDNWVPILHLIEPRSLRQRDMEYGRGKMAKNKPFASCYYELGCDEEKVLLESGYDEFPVLSPRWHTRGRDVYGHGPGFKALGDIKQLQHEQLRKGQAIDYMVKPVLGLPGEAKGREHSMLPGGVVYMGSAQTAPKGAALFNPTLDLQHLLLDIEDVRKRINRAFYADLFLMISQDQRRTPVTAREIAERHEEKLLMLGPVLERLHDEMLSPLIDSTFAKLVRAGVLPEPPQEMQGVELKVEFVSTLAQAQRAVGLGSVDRLIGTVTLIAQGKQDPAIFDKLDMDQIIDKYADMLAVDPSLIVADDKIAIIREGRAKAQAQAQAAQNAQMQAETAAKLASAKTGEEQNALTDVMRQFQGYT